MVQAARQIRDLLTIVPRALRLKANEVEYGIGSAFVDSASAITEYFNHSATCFVTVAQAGGVGISPTHLRQDVSSDRWGRCCFGLGDIWRDTRFPWVRC
jgi:hypothetical protein